MLVLILLGAAPPRVEPLPPNAVARWGNHRFYHGPGLRGAALSPDGRRAASTGDRLAVWDAVTGALLWERKGEGRAVAFSRDGRRLAVAETSRVVLLDTQWGGLIAEAREEADRLAFAPDGRLLCGGTVALFLHGETLRLLKRVEGRSIAAALRGKEVAAEATPLQDGTSIAWRVGRSEDEWHETTALVIADPDGKFLLREPREERFESFAFSANGRRFITRDGTVRDARTGRRLLDLLASSGDWAFSPDGRLLLHCSGDGADLHDARTGRKLRQLMRHVDRCEGIASSQRFSADGRRVLLTTSGTLRLFDTATGRGGGPEPQTFWSIRLSGKTVEAEVVDGFMTWDAPRLRLVSSRPRRAWEAAARSDDGRLVLKDDGEAVETRDRSSGRVLARFDGWKHYQGGGFSPDGRNVLLSVMIDDKRADERMHDSASGKLLWSRPAHMTASLGTFSPNGKLIAYLLGAGEILLVDAATGKTLRKCVPAKPLAAHYATLSFSADSERLVLTQEFRTGGCGNWFLGSAPTLVYRASDGKEQSRIWLDAETKEQGLELFDAVLSPDGRLLAACFKKETTVRLLEIASGRCRAVLAGHRGPVRRFAFSPDGKRLASAGDDSVVFLWDVPGPGGDPFAVRPVVPADAEETKRLIAELGADGFDTRRRAIRELEALGERAAGPLQAARAKAADLEQRLRIDALLERIALDLRGLRAVEGLERLGTPEALRQLEKLAGGAPVARLTEEARAALRRLRRPVP